VAKPNDVIVRQRRCHLDQQCWTGRTHCPANWGRSCFH